MTMLITSTVRRFLAAPAALAALLAMSSTAHAAIDVTAATTGISEASAAVTTVLGAMIAFAIVRYGLRKVLSLLGR